MKIYLAGGIMGNLSSDWMKYIRTGGGVIAETVFGRNREPHRVDFADSD